MSTIWTLLPITFVFCYAASIPIEHSDVFYTLMNGRLMVDFHMVPVLSDPLTYAPQASLFFNQPWIAQLIFLGAQRVGGYAGIIFVHAVAMASAFGLLAWVARRCGARTIAACLIALGAFLVASTNFNIRPQSFAPVLFVGCCALLRPRPMAGWRGPVAIVLLTVVWSNLHGSFFLAPGLAGLHFAGAVLEERSLRVPRVRAYLRLALGAFLATFVNPAGPGIWLYALRSGTDPTNRNNIAEWQPSTPDTLTGQLLLGGLAILILVFVLSRRRPTATDILILAAFTFLGFSTQRAVIWWALTAAVVVAAQLKLSRVRRPAVPVKPELAGLNALLLCAIASLMVLSVPWFRAVNPLLAPELRPYLSADHPTAALQYMNATGAQGRLFARMEWGGYAEWWLWPRVIPFLDARVEQHPPTVWADYFAILSAAPDWQARLDKYGADYLLLERKPFAALVDQVDASPRWQRVYSDDLSVLYQRTS